MASKIDTSSTFRSVAVIAVALLIGAAALVYLQPGGGSPSAPQLAALSQAIPAQASRALNGDTNAFDELGASVRDVAELRRMGSPGRSSDWQQLASRAATILAKRSEVEAILAAASRMATDSSALIALADELLDRSSATAAIMEFQQRANRIREASANLIEGGGSAASAIAEDVAYLRNVSNALDGIDSDLDIRPLNSESREIALVPVISSLTSLEEQVAFLDSNIVQVS